MPYQVVYILNSPITLGLRQLFHALQEQVQEKRRQRRRRRAGRTSLNARWLCMAPATDRLARREARKRVARGESHFRCSTGAQVEKMNRATYRRLRCHYGVLS